jgi:Acyl dehydratase
MALAGYSMATAAEFVGRELGVSDWVAVDQDRIDAFAECTGDRQWIHIDVERARRESPFGGRSPTAT